jgi:hypothetical protein
LRDAHLLPLMEKLRRGRVMPNTPVLPTLPPTPIGWGAAWELRQEKHKLLKKNKFGGHDYEKKGSTAPQTTGGLWGRLEMLL